MMSEEVPKEPQTFLPFHNARLVSAFEDELVIECGGLEIPFPTTHGHLHSEKIGKIGVAQQSCAEGGWVFVPYDEQ
jgi:hypothetical protein